MEQNERDFEQRQEESPVVENETGIIQEKAVEDFEQKNAEDAAKLAEVRESLGLSPQEETVKSPEGTGERMEKFVKGTELIRGDLEGILNVAAAGGTMFGKDFAPALAESKRALEAALPNLDEQSFETVVAAIEKIDRAFDRFGNAGGTGAVQGSLEAVQAMGMRTESLRKHTVDLLKFTRETPDPVLELAFTRLQALEANAKKARDYSGRLQDMVRRYLRR